MEEFALVAHGAGAVAEIDTIEPIVDHNFARKKMIALEQGIAKLGKDARQQHEAVLVLGGDMKSMVSELDLRRAIGLAFQEFEVRLEDVFQDSNRKCVAMFSKREEVNEIQAVINKKVNWTDFNTVLKKLSDLRQYVDTMAESVFVGHKDSMNNEFAKKADAVTVDEALKSKADFSELSEVRARLERLEVLVSHTDARHSAQLDKLRAESAKQVRMHAEEQQAVISEHTAVLATLKTDLAGITSRLGTVEGELGSVKETGRRMKEIEQVFKVKQGSILSSISSMQEQLQRLDESAQGTHSALQILRVETEENRDTSGQKLNSLVAQGDSFKERLDFLMQATEMIKRKSRETNKNNLEKFKEFSEDQEKHCNQLAALERLLKKQERAVTSIEHRTGKSDGHGASASLRALPPQMTMASALDLLGGEPSTDPSNERLKGILDQLEKIAGGGHPFEQMGLDVDPGRPPLPYGGPSDTDGSSQTLPRFAALAGPAPIDSARGVAYPSSAAAPPPMRQMHGLSPRTQAPGAPAKTPRRKR